MALDQLPDPFGFGAGPRPVFFRTAGLPPILVDATLRAEHEIAVEVTQNPTEDGRIDGGTKRTLPRRVTLEIAVTDQDRSGVGRAIPFHTGSRHVDFVQVMEQLWVGTELFDIHAGSRKYKNCTGEGALRWIETPERKTVAVLVGTFREIEAGTVRKNLNVADETVPAASGKVNLGTQGTEAIDG